MESLHFFQKISYFLENVLKIFITNTFELIPHFDIKINFPRQYNGNNIKFSMIILYISITQYLSFFRFLLTLYIINFISFINYTVKFNIFSNLPPNCYLLGLKYANLPDIL